MEPQKIKEHIGQKIRALRKAQGLSMRVAYKIRNDYEVKIDPSYLSRIERGRVEIPLRTLLALADYYKVSPAWLLDTESEYGETSGTDYVMESPEVVDGLKSLAEMVGEDRAREYVSLFLNHVVNVAPDEDAEDGVTEAKRMGMEKLEEFMLDQKPLGSARIGAGATETRVESA